MKKQHILSHFQQKDPIIYSVLSQMEFEVLQKPSETTNFYQKLTQEIVYQQLSGKAASTIYKRFCALFPNAQVVAQAVLNKKDQELREVGLSWAKVKYVKDLAQKTVEGKIAYDHLLTMDPLEVVKELVQVKGIGQWTAEMFLMFTLGNEDVFSLGDLGLRNGLIGLYKLRESPTLSKRMLAITNRWKPYRTYGCLALWHYKDVVLPNL